MPSLINFRFSNEFIHCIDECQTDCQWTGKNSRAHRQNTVAEEFLHCQCLLCSKFRAWSFLKNFVETVEKNQTDNQRRAEKSAAEYQNRRVLFEKFFHDQFLLSCDSLFNPLKQREVYHRKNFWQCAIVIVSIRVWYCSACVWFCLTKSFLIFLRKML